MDTITQIALGAAVGEAALGKKVGNKAVAWGAVGGTIPDLDVLIMPFVSEVQALAIHRGFSHSITFAILFAPVFGWIIHKIHRNAAATWKDWSWLAFWTVFTHPILDSFTVYGTQLFQPFSDYPVAWNSIFIIDPAYTLPLLAGVITVCFLRRNASLRRKINYAALALSTFYLLLGFAIKLHVQSVFETSLNQQQISYNHIMNANTPFNIFLWMGIAETEETQWVGLYSIFDKDTNIQFQEIPKNKNLIAAAMNQPAIKRLMWFSRGYYTVKEHNGTLYFNDLRFGRSDIWLDNDGRYIFSFELQSEHEQPNQITGFQRKQPEFVGTDEGANEFQRLLARLLVRMWGK